MSYAMAKIDRQMQVAASGAGHTPNDNCSTSIMPFCNTIRIDFNKAEHARIVQSVLEVDKELQPHKVRKEFEVHGNSLCIYLRATEWRMLRVATSSFYDMAMVAVQCLDEFG